MSEREYPRLLNGKTLCKYLGITYPVLTRLMRAGQLPPKVSGTTFYDRKAVDAWLDRAAGLGEDQEDKSEYERWKDANGSAADEGHQANQDEARGRQ